MFTINEKNYQNSDYTKQTEEQKYILDQLTAFRNRQAIENNMQFDLLKFINYAENGLITNRNLKQDKELLESKNEELNYQIAKIKTELKKPKNQNNSNNLENIVNDENHFIYKDNNYSKSWDENYSKNPILYK